MPTLVAHRSSACSARILSKVHDLVITLGSRKLLPNTRLVVGVRGFKTDYPNLVVSFWYVQMPCVIHPLKFQFISSMMVVVFHGPFCQVFDAVIIHQILAGRPSSWRLWSSHRSFELHLKHHPACGDSSESWVLDGCLWRCGGTCGGGSVNL